MNSKKKLMLVSTTTSVSRSICWLMEIVAAPLFVSVLFAQGLPSATVDRAVQAHGVGWQNGAVKNWIATGQVTIFRYDDQNQQSYDIYPMTLIHAADTTGGGGAGDRLQRLIFQPPDPDGLVNVGNATVSSYSLHSVLSREGTDGAQTWHSSGPLSTPAAGRAQRFIEAHTVRSLEALFNYRGHGGTVADIAARILSLNPGANLPPGLGQADRVHPRPSFQVAANARVIELSAGLKGPTTRYYIDKTTGLVARMEFDYAQGPDPLSGQMVPLTEIYEFSNYQDVPLTGAGLFATASTAPAATVKFPMVIDRYVVGRKVKTMVFTQVLLNQNLQSESFQR